MVGWLVNDTYRGIRSCEQRMKGNFTIVIGTCFFYIAGAGRAKGKVITFLDAHCECTEGWLEPLAYEIHKDR